MVGLGPDTHMGFAVFIRPARNTPNKRSSSTALGLDRGWDSVV